MLNHKGSSLETQNLESIGDVEELIKKAKG